MIQLATRACPLSALKESGHPNLGVHFSRLDMLTLTVCASHLGDMCIKHLHAFAITGATALSLVIYNRRKRPETAYPCITVLSMLV